MLSVRTGFPGAQSLRVSPCAWVYHFTSSSEVRSGFPSPGMKCPRNQPRVSFDASVAFPKIGGGVSELMARYTDLGTTARPDASSDQNHSRNPCDRSHSIRSPRHTTFSASYGDAPGANFSIALRLT